MRVLPGNYPGREDSGGNLGAGHIRIALVAGLEDCVRAAKHFRELIGTTVQEQANEPGRSHQ